jgi:hypothetical protein
MGDCDCDCNICEDMECGKLECGDMECGKLFENMDGCFGEGSFFESFFSCSNVCMNCNILCMELDETYSTPFSNWIVMLLGYIFCYPIFILLGYIFCYPFKIVTDPYSDTLTFQRRISESVILTIKATLTCFNTATSMIFTSFGTITFVVLAIFFSVYFYIGIAGVLVVTSIFFVFCQINICCLTLLLFRLTYVNWATKAFEAANSGETPKKKKKGKIDKDFQDQDYVQGNGIY